MARLWNDKADPIADIKNAIEIIKDKTKKTLSESIEEEKQWRKITKSRLEKIFDENIQPKQIRITKEERQT